MALKVGQRLKRRAPEGDDPWNEIIVRGHFDLGPDGGGLEVVVSPAGGFDTPATCTSQSLFQAYTLDVGDPASELEAGLAKLKAAPEWQTPASDLENA